MREHLFKGKSENTNDWCIGSLVYSPSENQYYIIEHDGEELSFPVDPEAICEYTQLKDKNGTKIWENDIVSFNNQIFKVIEENGAFGLGSIDCINYKKIKDDVFNQTENYYSGVMNDNFISLWEINWAFNNDVDIEVLGNIFDNPELLK